MAYSPIDNVDELRMLMGDLTYNHELLFAIGAIRDSATFILVVQLHTPQTDTHTQRERELS